MDNETKYCVDCKFFKVDFIDKLFFLKEFGKCTHEMSLSKDYDLISPKNSMKRSYFAKTMRKFDCGKEAKFFEAK